MTHSCSKCGAYLDSGWSFCHDCGTARAPEEHPHVERAPLPAGDEPAPVKRALSGLFFGIVLTPVCIIVGTMLCLTGLGAFAGIPLIVFGALAPLLGPMVGMDIHAGICPWCGSKVTIVPLVDAFNCHQCHHKITMKNHRDMVRAA